MYKYKPKQTYEYLQKFIIKKSFLEFLLISTSVHAVGCLCRVGVPAGCQEVHHTDKVLDNEYVCVTHYAAIYYSLHVCIRFTYLMIVSKQF